MTTSATDCATADSPFASVIAFAQGRAKAPDAAQTVQRLLALEKSARRDRQPLSSGSLWGDWRLVFITGTTRSRRTAGKVLGAGRFLPRWIAIAIAYRPLSPPHSEPDIDSTPDLTPGLRGDRELGLAPDLTANLGSVDNHVRFGGVDLTVSGPIRLYGSQRILAFDFIRIRFALAGLTLFQGYVRGGQAREQAFAAKSLRDQAFFTYFWVEEQLIAARGRGGGLAIWVREGAAASPTDGGERADRAEPEPPSMES